MSREDKDRTLSPVQGHFWTLETEDFSKMSKSYFMDTKIPKVTATKIKIVDESETERKPDTDSKPERKPDTDLKSDGIKPDGIKSKSEDSDTRKPPPKPPEPSLEQFMMNLFPMIDKQHEILEGLQRGSIYDFFEFSTMSETDISGLTKIIHSKPEPLGNMSTRRLISLSRMVTLAQINNVPGSHLASSYTRGDLGMFMKDENDNKRAFVAYTTSTTMTPSFTAGTPTKSPGEKRY